MPAYPASASGPPKAANRRDGGVLISAVNWLGDSVMSMSAIRVFRRRGTESRIAVLVKPGLAPLWRMCPDVDAVVELRQGLRGTIATVRSVREEDFRKALVFPNSFRSALIPFLARIPERVGQPGHCRDWMLTGVVRRKSLPGREHQVYEYLDLMGVEPDGEPELPALAVPGNVVDGCRRQVESFFAAGPSSMLLGILPGAARGPAKRWPAACFAEAGRILADKTGCRIVLLGSPGDADICAAVAAGMGRPALDLSGRTSLTELAAILSLCDAVISNDSGGMHLAAAMGTGVAAVFGLTDPARTGPLGEKHRLVFADGVSRSRDIPRDSTAARLAMESIRPQAVCDAVMKIVASRGRHEMTARAETPGNSGI